MKTKNLICIAIILLCYSRSFSQFVFIPDSNFRNIIKQNIAAAAIVGDSLDTLNVNLISKKIFSIGRTNFDYNLQGIQYFDSLEWLHLHYSDFSGLSVFPPLLKNLTMQASATVDFIDINNTSLISININNADLLDFSSIPNSVQYINTSVSDFSVSAFPSALISFVMQYNHSTSVLPSFPQGLKKLSIHDSWFMGITDFPDSLNKIDLVGNINLSVLPNLPVNLDTLITNSCALTQVNLPFSLIYLDISGNNITSIGTFPSSLVYAGLTNNDLDSLPSLPPSLEYLSAENNNLHSIPPVPATLRNLYISYNPLDVFPVLNQTLLRLSCRKNIASIIPVTGSAVLKTEASQLRSF